MRLQRDAAPGEAGPRGHCGRLGGYLQRNPLRAQRAGGRCHQVSGPQVQPQCGGRTGALQRQARRERAERRQPCHCSHQPAGRLFNGGRDRQGCLGQPRLHRHAPRPFHAFRHEPHRALVECREVERAGDRQHQGGVQPGHRRGQLQPRDAQRLHRNLHRQVPATAAAGGRPAAHDRAGRRKRADLRPPAQQRERGPACLHLFQHQPGAFGVVHLHAGGARGAGDPAFKAHQLHLPAGGPFDQPGNGVALVLRGGGPGQQQAGQHKKNHAHQKACPMPM